MITNVMGTGRSRNNNFLHRGDRIRLEPGMKVYADIPTMFRGGNFFDTEKRRVDIIIGEIYKNKPESAEELTETVFERIKYTIPADKQQVAAFVDSLNIDMEEKAFDTSVYAGEYKVLIANFDGDGSASDGEYPPGWHVYCYKEGDPSICVDFYQSGCFTAMIEDIKPINR